MVVTAHRLASEAGIAILQQGGNAIDAAVAVGYAEAVVNPCCGNIGGGGFMVAHLADGRDVFLNFRETAPAAATRDMYLDAAGQYRARREPAWLARRRGARHGAGARHRADAIRHAAAIGGDGAGDPPGARRLRADPLRHRHHAAFHGIVPPRAKRRADLPASRRIAAATGRPADAADLAATLQAIAEHGPDAFYRGRIPQEVEAASRAGGGIITAADFAAYRITQSAPLSCTYRGFRLPLRAAAVVRRRHACARSCRCSKATTCARWASIPPRRCM